MSELVARPVLLGMNNPYSADPADALVPWPVGCAGWRLYEMLRAASTRAGGAEVTRDEYVAAFDRRNVLSARSWSARDARAAAAGAVAELVGRRTVVLGKQTASALRLSALPGGTDAWFEWSRVFWGDRALECIVVPHPSGLCREYNVPETAARVGDLLLSLYRGKRP